MDWAVKFWLRYPHSLGLYPTDIFFTHTANLLEGKHVHIQHNAESIFQEFFKPQTTGFYAT